jgi:selenocysteine-specific elongation factor
MTVVVGTAGHIDHGKTTLLQALTGIDADRLPEERRRGMTIDVGYAHLALPDGSELDFVDVPGHDRLIGNMLVGAGEIDAALLVVAADDGPRAQTLEHLELLDALGIADGIGVVTKADVVEAGRAEDVAAATGRLLARTTLAGAPVVIVSARSGAGLDGLRDALTALRDRVVARGLPAGPARLAIDRTFNVRGRGIVVTGTLRGGPLERGTALRLVPGETTVRIRELQVHGRSVDAAPGGRTAVNLVGADGAGLGRWSVLTTDPAVTASDRLLVALRRAAGLVGGAPPLPGDRARVQLHLGTARVGGVVGRSSRESIELRSGETTAIVRLEQPIAVAPGDRFVLRRASPAATLAAGRVIDPAPPRGVSRRRATEDRLAALAESPAGGDSWTTARLDLHGVVAGTRSGAIELAADIGAWMDEAIMTAVAERDDIPQAELAQAIGRALRRLVTLPAAATRTALPVFEAIDRLVVEGRLAREGGRIHEPGRAASGPPPAVVAAMDRLEQALDDPAPPALADAARLAGCPPEGVRALESGGRIVRLDDDLAYAAATFASLETRALEMASREPLTPAAFRDATGTSRKYVMAILEELDRRGALRRTPDGHVPGPRARLVAGP